MTGKTWEYVPETNSGNWGQMLKETKFKENSLESFSPMIFEKWHIGHHETWEGLENDFSGGALKKKEGVNREVRK